tara:strand:- start:460 stop:687 length:228 start_codon:yes stop_codon:yes gene_type:complete
MPCWDIKPGDLVRIRRRKWENPEAGDTGIIISQAYLAYDPANSKWRVMKTCDGTVETIQGKNLFPVFKGVQEEQA